MTASNQDSGQESVDRWSSLSDDQIVDRLRAVGGDELDPQTRRLLDRIADEVLASINRRGEQPGEGPASRGNSAA
jgi:hypothetical protein